MIFLFCIPFNIIRNISFIIFFFTPPPLFFCPFSFFNEHKCFSHVSVWKDWQYSGAHHHYHHHWHHHYNHHHNCCYIWEPCLVIFSLVVGTQWFSTTLTWLVCMILSVVVEMVKPGANCSWPSKTSKII